MTNPIAITALMTTETAPTMAAEMIAGRIERDKAHFRQVFARRGVDWDRVAIKFDFAAYISQYYNAVEGNCPMPRRGLFLIGPTGIGKTFLLRKFAQFFRLKFITSAELAEMAKYDGLDILRRFLTLPFSSWGRGDCDLIIDEIAECEKHEVINYGQDNGKGLLPRCKCPASRFRRSNGKN